MVWWKYFFEMIKFFFGNWWVFFVVIGNFFYVVIVWKEMYRCVDEIMIVMCKYKVFVMINICNRDVFCIDDEFWVMSVYGCGSVVKVFVEEIMYIV